MEQKGSEDKIGEVDLRRVDLLRKSGVKITPAQREYYRYTGISAEVEKRGLGSRFPSAFAPKSKEKHTHA